MGLLLLALADSWFALVASSLPGLGLLEFVEFSPSPISVAAVDGSFREFIKADGGAGSLLCPLDLSVVVVVMVISVQSLLLINYFFF